MTRRPGVHATAEGTSVAVHAPGADLVEFCVDTADGEYRYRLHRDDALHVADLPSLAVGTRYGFRAHGPAHHPDKLLLDPYTRAVTGSFRWHPALWPGGGDSAPHVARSVYVEPAAATDTRPRIPWSETIVYETHVRGITRTHPEVPPRLRGTYAGLASEPIIEHLTGLGVTTVELLPIARFVHEAKLLRRGLRQYWGYMPIAPLAPHDAYATDRSPTGVIAEVAAMVETLHAAGLEVIVDVVLNHTGEGPENTSRGLNPGLLTGLLASVRSLRAPGPTLRRPGAELSRRSDRPRW